MLTSDNNYCGQISVVGDAYYNGGGEQVWGRRGGREQQQQLLLPGSDVIYCPLMPLRHSPIAPLLRAGFSASPTLPTPPPSPRL